MTKRPSVKTGGQSADAERAAEEQLGPPIDVAATVERYHALAGRTQNPVYAWYALQLLIGGPAAIGGYGPEWPVANSLSVPGWIVNYLQQVTGDLLALADGIDPWVETEPFDFRGYATSEEVLSSDEFRKHAELSKISATAAMRAVPRALGFVRDTWNAFAAHKSNTDKMHEFRWYQAAIEKGIPAKVAVGAIRTALNVADDSSIYVRIRKGREIAEGKEVAGDKKANKRKKVSKLPP